MMKRLNWLFASLSLFVVFGCGGPAPVEIDPAEDSAQTMTEEDVEAEQDLAKETARPE